MQIHPSFGVGTKEARNVPLNIGARDAAAVFGQKAIVLRENRRECSARIAPFVDDLLENAGVGMLRDETRPEHFDSLTSDLFDDRWIVHEPPAAERHEVAEFSSQDAKLMLIFAAENTDEKTVGRKIATEIFQAAQVRPANAVAAKAKPWIDLFADTNHQRKRQAQFATGRQDGFLK